MLRLRTSWNRKCQTKMA